MNTYSLTFSTHAYDSKQKIATVVLSIPEHFNGCPMNEIPEKESKLLMSILSCFKQLEVELKNQQYSFQMELNNKIVIDHHPEKDLTQN